MRGFENRAGGISKKTFMAENLIPEENVLTYNQFNEGVGMKFDFVVGNPPFSDGRPDGKGGKSSNDILYVKFFNKARELANNIAMILPSTLNKQMKEHNLVLSEVVTDYREISKEEFPGPTIDMWYVICLANAPVKSIPFTISDVPKNNIIWGRGKLDMYEHKNNAKAAGYGEGFIGYTEQTNADDVKVYHKITKSNGLEMYYVPNILVPTKKRFPSSGFVVLVPQTMTDAGWVSTEIVECCGQAAFLNLKTVFFDTYDDAKRFQEFMQTEEFIDGAKKVRAGFNQLTIAGLQSIPFHFVI